VSGEWLENAGRRFARLTTRVVVARPGLWRIFRPLTRKQFDWLAPAWEARRAEDMLAPLAAALEHLPSPRRILDVGTGTGKGAKFIAESFPRAEVVGVDLSPDMIDEARRLLPEDLTGRVRYEVGDAAHLPFEAASFDLVILLNMIPFFDEIARLTAPEGAAVFVSSAGPETPIYTPPAMLRERLAPLDFGEFEEIAAGEGTALVARRTKRG
jgi:SAM-dependent methyltransferase